MRGPSNVRIIVLGIAVNILLFSSHPAAGTEKKTAGNIHDRVAKQFKKVTPSERKTAAERFKAAYETGLKERKKETPGKHK